MHKAPDPAGGPGVCELNYRVTTYELCMIYFAIVRGIFTVTTERSSNVTVAFTVRL